MKKLPGNTGISSLINDLRRMIEDARMAVALTVNTGLTALYWHIGKRINDEILEGERAAYGDEIVSTVSRQLALEYGAGFSVKNVRHMMKFAEAFPEDTQEHS